MFISRGVLALMMALPIAAMGQVQGLVTTINDANALSTPAARHLVRVDPGGGFAATYLLAIQRENYDSLNGVTPAHPGLGLYSSASEGATWSFYAAINTSNYGSGGASERDTADVIKVGNDIALVYSYDGPSIVPDTTLDPLHKVYFQWWKYNGAGGWTGQTPVLIFSPFAGSAYHRAELAVDSAGRIWVQAWLRSGPACATTACALCGTQNGDNYGNTLVMAVSTDNGTTFQQQPSLATTVCRAGGRLSSLGTKLMMLWNDYSDNQNGAVVVTQFVTRSDSDPLSSWTPAANAFTDDLTDGIYHGAALSGVADGVGGLHLVYKNHSSQQLYYRYFNGSSFLGKQLLDPSHDDFALQAAATLFNGDLYVFANHLVNSDLTPWPANINLNNYEIRFWAKSSGWSAYTVVDNQSQFKGYPAAAEMLPSNLVQVPMIFGQTPDARTSGNARVTFSPNFSLSANPTSIQVTQGSTGNSAVTTTPAYGFSSSLTLSASGVPAGASVTFSPNPVAVGTSSTAVFNSGTAALGTYPVTLTGTGGGLARSTTLTCQVRALLCDASSCPTGCCDGNVCRDGTSNAYCGAPVRAGPGGTTPPGGQACSQCYSPDTCQVDPSAAYFACTPPGCGYGQICP